MDKKEIKKRKRKRNRLIKSLVLVVAFVIAIGATFGATMAYFGGTSGTSNYDMVLKMGLYVGVPEQTEGQIYAYVVPSQVVTASCEFTVKSAKTATGDDSVAVSGVAASNGLIRAKIEFSGITGVTLDSGTDNQVYFPVKLNGTTIGNFVKRDTTDGTTADGYYYLIKGTSFSGDDDSDDYDAEMYTVETSSGEQKFTFDLRVSIPKSLTNDNAGQEITLNVTYEVIQADFYDSSKLLDKTVKNAYNVFTDSSLTDKNAGYTYGTAS